MDCQIDSIIMIRFIVTLIIFYLISKNKIKWIENNLLIILAFILLLLDYVDGFLIKHVYKIRKCLKSFNYQSSDKILDIFTYSLLLFVLPNNSVLKFFILIRFIGTVLFYFTRNSVWLIYFFDFVKEYLVHLYFFGKNSSFLYFFVVLKIMFEFYFHTFHNKNNYKINVNS